MSEHRETFEALLASWRWALKDARRVQERVLGNLLFWYDQGRYGHQHGAGMIRDWEEFQRAFPVVTYQTLSPLWEQVKRGDFRALYGEHPVEWAVNSSSGGEPQTFPLIKVDLDQRLTCQPRALLSFLYRRDRHDMLQPMCLNLNPPSRREIFKTRGGKEIPCGYSSGIYARHLAEKGVMGLVPRQTELDDLGLGLSAEDWERRFQLVYEKGRDQRVDVVVAPGAILLAFGRFLRKRHGLRPKEMWVFQVVIHSGPQRLGTMRRMRLKKLYGEVPVLEMLETLGGFPAQQMDDSPCLMPNFDLCLLEVETKKGFQLLCDLQKGVSGSLIISSVLAPRLRVGLVIKSLGGMAYTIVKQERGPSRFRRELRVLRDQIRESKETSWSLPKKHWL
jgi:hypothetical protein